MGKSHKIIKIDSIGEDGRENPKPEYDKQKKRSVVDKER
jgi:hypothetical protein